MNKSSGDTTGPSEKRSGVQILPPELWIIITDLVIEAGIIPQKICDHLNFPEILLHLRSPREYPPLARPWHDLRLVCRNFKEILGPSPYLLLGDTIVTIPSSTRAVYMVAYQDPVACFQRLLEEPSSAKRIISLDIVCEYHQTTAKVVPFDMLCIRSSSITGVRCLTLNLTCTVGDIPVTELWGRINAAFPMLVSLVLRTQQGPLHGTHGIASLGDNLVTFEALEILDVDYYWLNAGIRFPRLRHIAFRHYYTRDIDTIRHSPLLESILVRSMVIGTEIDSTLFPQLRLMGVPNRGGPLVFPLLPKHPLQHVHAYMLAPYREPFDFKCWVKKILWDHPVASRITLDLSRVKPIQRIWFRTQLQSSNLEALGLSARLPPNESQCPLIIIMDRISVRLSDKPVGKGPKRGWNKVRQYASRRVTQM